MSDLISRKVLLQQLRTDEALGFDDFYETVENSPVAYDVDKVVGQLENKMFSAELHGDEWDGQTVSNLLCMGDVYEIVKGGGQGCLIY